MIPWRLHPPRREKPRRGPADIAVDRWRNPLYLSFLRTECRCCVCNALFRRGLVDARMVCKDLDFMAAEPCHGPVSGFRSKGPDAEALPMCRHHHDEQHRIGWPAFEIKYEFHRDREAEAHFALFLIWKESLAE